MKKSLNNHYLVLILISTIVYFNSIFNPFIWDDFSLIVDNPYIKSFKLSLLSFSKDIYSGSSNFYRPLQIIFYSLIYKISKLNPVGYHIFNILLHTLCSVLIFILLKEIYAEKISFLASLIWAIHPINTESITYISGTADPLFLFFGLLAIYFYNLYLSTISFALSFEGRWKKEGFKRIIDKKNFLFLFFSYIFFIFSLLSKETGILTLPLFFLYLYCCDRLKKEELKNYMIIISIFLIYLILRQTVLKFGKPEFPEIFLYRFYTGFAVFLIYISILFFPFVLSIERHIPYIKTFKNLDFITGFIYFLIFLYFLYLKRRDTKIFFAGTIFLLNYLFHSNIIIPLNGNLREHWMYLGSIGFSVFCILILNKIKKEKTKKILLVVILLFYGIRTIIRNYDWKKPENLYLKSIKYSSYPSLLYGNLCYYYIKNGEYEKSYQISKKAILSGFKNESILYVYGLSLLNTGRYKEAETVFKEILNLNPENYEVLTEIGWLYFIKGEKEKAIEFLNRSLKINDVYPKTYYILTEIYRIQGNKNLFLKAVDRLTILVPDDFYPYYLKGQIFKEIGDLTNANKNFQKAYSILKNKNDFNSLFNLGILMREMGRVEESLNLFNKLLKIKPDNIEILNEIGICYAIKGNKEKAKEIWINILNEYPDYYPAKENLKRMKF